MVNAVKRRAGGLGGTAAIAASAGRDGRDGIGPAKNRRAGNEDLGTGGDDPRHVGEIDAAVDFDGRGLPERSSSARTARIFSSLAGMKD